MKEERIEIVRKFAVSAWWQPEFDEYFTEDISMDFPFAPPGMTQSMCTGQVWVHREWMKVTVPRYWKGKVERIYPPKDPEGDIYFVLFSAEGEVEWGGTEGHFNAGHCAAKITFRGSRICHVKQWSSPLPYYTAIGVSLPLFRVVPGKGDVLEAYYNGPEAPAADTGFVSSPEETARRRENNIGNFMETDKSHGYVTIPSPTNYSHTVWYCPPEMKDFYDDEEVKYMKMWSKSGSGSRFSQPDPIMYETDDPNVFFFETGNMNRNRRWGGNPYTMHMYSQRYLMHIEMDDDGFLNKYDEYLNPVGKFNSCNTPIPTFPYLF